jgi:D-glycero-D-manno-heptose 1,7-bisphosphate phosphatase
MFIILDRDGVINEDSDDYIKTPAEWIPIPGSLEAIAKLNQAGHTIVVATNQSGIARKLYSEADLQSIHATMRRQLAAVGGHVDAIFYCPHHPDDNCACRKPKPGLLLEIARQFKINLQEALMIGDAARDIQAAQAVGCPAILVKTGKGRQTLARKDDVIQCPIFENLAAVVAALIKP